MSMGRFLNNRLPRTTGGTTNRHCLAHVMYLNNFQLYITMSVSVVFVTLSDNISTQCCCTYSIPFHCSVNISISNCNMMCYLYSILDNIIREYSVLQLQHRHILILSSLLCPSNGLFPSELILSVIYL